MYNDSRPGTTHSMEFTVQYKRTQFGIGSILSGNYCVSFSLNFLVGKQAPSNQSRRVSLSTVYEDPGARKSHNKWLSLLLFPPTSYSEHGSYLGHIKSHQVSHCGFNAFDFLAQFPLHSQDFGVQLTTLNRLVSFDRLHAAVQILEQCHYLFFTLFYPQRQPRCLWFQLMSPLCPLHNKPLLIDTSSSLPSLAPSASSYWMFRDVVSFFPLEPTLPLNKSHPFTTSTRHGGVQLSTGIPALKYTFLIFPRCFVKEKK